MALTGWSTSAASNATVGSIDWAEGMAPAQVNNSARQMMADVAAWYRQTPEWVQRNDTPVYVSATQFKFTGTNLTSIYSVGRRIKLVAPTPGTIYGRITASAFVTDTTITVSWDSTSLTNEVLTSVAPSIIKGGLSAQSIHVGGLKGMSTFSSTLVGSTTTTAWRSGLGLGSIATQSSTGVSISGGSITGGTITGITDLAIADGGTGASSAATAFSNLKQQATTAATGVVELATDTETATGTDTARVAPVSSMVYHQGVSKAWVNFNGTGTVTINDSYNVTSITDNGTGDYTVNLTTAMNNASYAFSITAGSSSADAVHRRTISQSASALRFTTASFTPSNADAVNINVIIMGDR